MDFAYYIPLVCFNLFFLIFIPWGNQLGMTLVENIMIAIIMSIVTYFEKNMQVKFQKADLIRRNKKREQMRLMSAMDDSLDITTNKTIGITNFKETFRTLTVE